MGRLFRRIMMVDLQLRPQRGQRDEVQKPLAFKNRIGDLALEHGITARKLAPGASDADLLGPDRARAQARMLVDQVVYLPG